MGKFAKKISEGVTYGTAYKIDLARHNTLQSMHVVVKCYDNAKGKK